MAFSLNRRWLASGSADHTIRVWEVGTGRLAYTLHDNKELTTVALSPDGRLLASSSDESVKIWDVATGKVTHILNHDDAVQDVEFSPDGLLLASASSDSTLRVWEAESGRLVGGPLRHGDAVVALAFSPNSHLLASGSLDRTVKLWSVPEWLLVETLSFGERVDDLIFTLDGTRIMAVSENGNVTTWLAPTWRQIGNFNLNEHGQVSTWAISPDGQFLAVGTDKGLIQLRRLGH